MTGPSTPSALKALRDPKTVEERVLAHVERALKAASGIEEYSTQRRVILALLKVKDIFSGEEEQESNGGNNGNGDKLARNS